MRFHLLMGILAIAGPTLEGGARATDHPQAAQMLSLQRKATSGRESLLWRTKVPPVALPAASPLSAGATLRIAAGSGESATLTLPASGWSVNARGTVYRFTNETAPAGPSRVKVAVLKEAGVLKVVARATGISLDEPTQGTVSVALAIGTDVYCSACTAPRRDQPGAYLARQCAAPADCSSGFCGDNQVNQSSEECDGTDPGVCDDFPPPFPFACDAPGAPNACRCCWTETCVYFAYPGGPQAPCCGPTTCVNRTPVGSVRGGACVPPTCALPADCNGLDCVGGVCCARAGEVCDNIGCCANSGATCSAVSFAGSLICCRPAGAACTEFNECCSGSCNAVSQCD